MTIIAWKDGVMAADTMMSTGYGVRTGEGRKIITGVTNSGDNFIMGFSGAKQHMKAVEDWIVGKRPVPLPASGYTALVAISDSLCLNPKLLLVEDGGSEFVPYHAPRAAGSGAELAYGALFAGATAREAAAMCIEKSIYCGGSVEFATFGSNEVKVHG